MKILVFGKTGQVANELAKFDGVICVGREQADLSHPETCAAIIANEPWDAVINAAAYTAVDKAESEEAMATTINGDAPGAMARACKAKNIPFVHISTDYVFSGKGERPWQPNDPVDPQNAYGRSKLAGEQAIEAAGGNSAILRTSWVYSSHGNNFVKTMLRLGLERDTLNVINDQIGGPTDAASIARTCYEMAKQLATDPGKSGIYHFSGAPDASWADFAKEIFAQSNIDCVVHTIPTSEYPTPAKRPLNSRMDCSSTFATFGCAQPIWRDNLKLVLGELSA